MISCICRGGLGNFLYQASATFSQALNHGFEYAIPMEVENPHYVGQKQYILPGLNYCDKVPDLPHYNEPHFHYAEIPPTDNVVLNGYWQSEKYFDGHREAILKAFGFKWQHEKGVCAVHCRLGDYLLLPDYHPFVGVKYLVDALDEMNLRTGITKFRIFSNDQKFCREFFKVIPGYTFEFVEGNNEMQDLEQGSFCEHQILSNGTFALWMYYLNQNPNKMCIAPFRWFGKKLSHNTKDLYPPNAIILPNE